MTDLLHRVGEALLMDLLIMGAYSHPRLVEVLLGGATREILREACLPVLLHT